MTMLHTVTRTDIGRVRKDNEDVVVGTDRLAAVADGMGGHPGGEVASAIAIALVHAAFTGRSLDELQAGVRAGNRAIWDRACESSDLEGMGTTICAAGLVEDGRLAVVNVGDSRAYVLRNGALMQLTHDHSVTAEAVRRGELTEARRATIRTGVFSPERSVSHQRLSSTARGRHPSTATAFSFAPTASSRR